MDQNFNNKLIHILTDVIGYEFAETIIHKKVYIVKDIIYVVIGDGLYRFFIQEMIDNFAYKSGYKISVLNVFIRDSLMFSIVNYIIKYIKGEGESMKKIVLKSLIQSATSNLIYEKMYIQTTPFY